MQFNLLGGCSEHSRERMMPVSYKHEMYSNDRYPRSISRTQLGPFPSVSELLAGTAYKLGAVLSRMEI